jgi:hypothetical protein
VRGHVPDLSSPKEVRNMPSRPLLIPRLSMRLGRILTNQKNGAGLHQNQP